MRNLKKVIALVAVFAMMVSSVAFAQTFTDVADNHDYAEAIEMLSKLEILTGDDQNGDGKMDFRPEDTITRAEVAAIVSRIQNIDAAAQRDTEFVDVPASHWASGYVAQAAGQGIVNGYGDGNFGPEDPVLYEQVVKMLMETLGYGPFVVDNGGYPTGHLTAASRWGVTEGLIGASVGEVANRGQVAQMVYKAIDTPLMDRNVYGDTKEYIVYDGGSYYGRTYDYASLLTRDLHVKKFSGVVVANEITDETGAKEIDTTEMATVTVDVDDNAAFYNYDVADITGSEDPATDATVFVGDENLIDFIGKHVNVFVKKVDGRRDYEVISMAASNRNKVLEFTLDQYAGIDGDEIEYYKEGSKYTSVAKLDGTVTNYFNGILYDGTVFGNESGALVLADSKRSGKVTLIDNNSTNGYDVAVVKISTTGVVKEVAANGKVEFYNDVEAVEVSKNVVVEFDEDDNEQLIVLTKDGEAIEWTELKEWDVLSIFYNDESAYYEIDVIEAGKVDGTVTGQGTSKTSANGAKYTIAGESYDLAEGYYGNVKIGATGTFYIDQFGKIVAYDKNGANALSDKYAYVLNAAVVSDRYSEDVDTGITLLLLDKSGEIYEADLASRISIENPDVAGLDATDYDEENAYDTINVATKDIADLGALAAALKNSLIVYDSNSAGQVDEICFAVSSANTAYSARVDEGTFSTVDTAVASYDYDEVDKELGRYELTDDTVVFFINAEDGNMLSGSSIDDTASETSSKVSTYATLAEGTGYSAMVYNVDESDIPGAVVFFNTLGGISPSQSLAVIAEVGDANVDGDKVTSVSYYLNGELKYATTDPDMNDAALNAANIGDLWKFAFNADGSVIIAAQEYADFTRYSGYQTFNRGVAGDMTLAGSLYDYADLGVTDAVTTDVTFWYGPVIEYKSSSKSIILGAAEFEETAFTGWDLTTEGGRIRVGSETNVYVLDPNVRTGKLALGIAGAAQADEDLIAAIKVENKDDEAVWTAGDAEYAPLGMLDFAAGIEYDGDVLDVVIYKAYDFGKYYPVLAE